MFFFLSVSPCDFNLCENGGTCTVDSSGTAVCTCNGGWTGANCTGTWSVINEYPSNNGSAIIVSQCKSKYFKIVEGVTAR